MALTTRKGATAFLDHRIEAILEGGEHVNGTRGLDGAKDVLIGGDSVGIQFIAQVTGKESRFDFADDNVATYVRNRVVLKWIPINGDTVDVRAEPT